MANWALHITSRAQKDNVFHFIGHMHASYQLISTPRMDGSTVSHFILVFAIPAATLPEFLDFSAQSHCTTLALLVVVSSPHPVVQWGFVIHYDRVWYTLIYIHSHRLALTNIKRTGFLSIGLIAWVQPHQWDSVTRERCHTSLLDGLNWMTCGWQEKQIPNANISRPFIFG